jgi:hypothetical protein
MWTSFSMAAGGGVHGKGAGIAHRIMIQAGAIIKEPPPFIKVFPQVGGMITDSAVGKDINGTNKEYPTSKFNKTGRVGKGTDIGRNKIIGVSKA